jgi:arginyl-tRNA synthetase
VNPIHPIHIGGARNSIIGDCLARILEASGKDVKRHFYVDDVGLQVAQTSYGYSKAGGSAPRGSGALKGDHFIGFIYATTSCAMNIKRLKAEVAKLKSEGKDEDALKGIRELDDWASAANDLRAKNVAVFDAVFDAVLSSPDRRARSPACSRGMRAGRGGRGTGQGALRDGDKRLQGDAWQGRRRVRQLGLGERASILERRCRRSRKEALGDRVHEGGGGHDGPRRREGGREVRPEGEVLLEAGGPAAYAEALRRDHALHDEDLAYTLWKFGRAERVINVISIEQKLPQLQLKLALYALGKGDLADRLVHFSYELVHLPGYKMSGRRGRYVAFDDVLNEAVERAYREVSTKSPHLGEDERRKISEVVGIGSVRYAMIAVASNKPITFTWDRVLNFEQNSAPFIQYAHARACNILAKVGPEWAGGERDYAALSSKYEKDVVVKLAVFPDLVAEAGRNLRPEAVADYANDLASKFNHFYDNVPVLKTASPYARNARLQLVESVRTVLENALAIIGIEAPSRM